MSYLSLRLIPGFIWKYLPLVKESVFSEHTWYMLKYSSQNVLKHFIINHLMLCFSKLIQNNGYFTTESVPLWKTKCNIFSCPIARNWSENTLQLNVEFLVGWHLPVEECSARKFLPNINDWFPLEHIGRMNVHSSNLSLVMFSWNFSVQIKYAVIIWYTRIVKLLINTQVAN